MSVPPSGRTMYVVATAGHVDHGKSTLVRALTGTDPDRLVEERQRGLTIDLGFAWTALPGAGSVAFVDVPGHVRFVSNMLAGLAAVDAGLLCVDAREGWRAQTEEHLRVLDLLAAPAGVVAVTKAATVDDERLAAVGAEVALRTAGSVLAGAPVVTCDAVDGTGLDAVRRRLADALRSAPDPAPSDDRPRLWVDRSFTIVGAGTVVTGSVDRGGFDAGAEVTVVGAAGEISTRIRGIQALGRATDRAPAHSRAALNLAGVDRRAVRRGDAVVDDAWHRTAQVDATLRVLDAVDHAVTARGAYLAHIGAGEHAVRLRLSGSSPLRRGDLGVVRLRLPHPLPLAPGDRYILRESGRRELIGGGEIVDTAPARAITSRTRTDGTAALKKGEWVPAGELSRRAGVAVEPVIGPWVVAPETLTAAREDVLRRVESARPAGLDLGPLGARDRAVITALRQEGAVDVHAGYAVLPAWRDELAHHPAVADLEARPFAPPAITTYRLTPETMRALVRRGYVVGCDGTYFASQAVTDAGAIVADLASARPEGVTVGEVRTALGTTRRWALPLLQLLDDRGVTVRRGDRRTVARPQPPGRGDHR